MLIVYAIFIAIIVGLLVLDLGVFNRRPHVVSVRESLGWSAVWIGLGLGFAFFVYGAYENHWFGIAQMAGARAVDAIDQVPLTGKSAAVKYLTGYVVEKSLSIDNIFVIAMIFSFLAIPAIYQHRVLFWGILGALVMRGIMIFLGAQLIHRYHWIIWIFGAFLIFTGIKMLVMKSGHGDPGRNWVLKAIGRFFPITREYQGQHFLVRAADAGVKFALTPLAVALVLVESTDVVFAVDSIPAIFAITADPFLVFTSNIFALLGLRSLYFALAGMIPRFQYLKHSLAVILVVVGVKMLAAAQLKEMLGPGFNYYLLGLILLILAAGVGVSLFAARAKPAAA